MKLFFKSLCCALAISCLLSMTGFCGACNDIENQVFRLHILANSDSAADQNLKLKVRDGILDYTQKIFKDCKNKEQSMMLAERNLENIENYAQSLIYEYGYNYNVNVYITKMPFSTRTYQEFKLPAGKYDALRVVIGKGEGHNWWCVLYPALCLPSAEGNELNKAMNDKERDIVTESDKYEIKFKFVEIFEGLCSWF